MDVSDFDARPPLTRALVQQKALSQPRFQAMWYNMLVTGSNGSVTKDIGVLNPSNNLMETHQVQQPVWKTALTAEYLVREYTAMFGARAERVDAAKVVELFIPMLPPAYRTLITNADRADLVDVVAVSAGRSTVVRGSVGFRVPPLAKAREHFSTHVLIGAELMWEGTRVSADGSDNTVAGTGMLLGNGKYDRIATEFRDGARFDDFNKRARWQKTYMVATMFPEGMMDFTYVPTGDPARRTALPTDVDGVTRRGITIRTGAAWQPSVPSAAEQSHQQQQQQAVNPAAAGQFHELDDLMDEFADMDSLAGAIKRVEHRREQERVEREEQRLAEEKRLADEQRKQLRKQQQQARINNNREDAARKRLAAIKARAGGRSLKEVTDYARLCLEVEANYDVLEALGRVNAGVARTTNVRPNYALVAWIEEQARHGFDNIPKLAAEAAIDAMKQLFDANPKLDSERVSDSLNFGGSGALTFSVASLFGDELAAVPARYIDLGYSNDGMPVMPPWADLPPGMDSAESAEATLRLLLRRKEGWREVPGDEWSMNGIDE